MLFCGDMSVPNSECCEKLANSMDSIGLFKEQTVIINLEGVLLDNEPTDSFWKVYNDKSVVKLKEHCGQLIFCLANNHTYDYPEHIQSMTKTLAEHGIKFFGLERTGEIVPLEFVDNGVQYAVFGHCWEVYTRTNRNKVTKDRVVDCNYEKLYKTITTYMVDNPNRKVIVYLHWNFDMEEYPQPAYKQLAHDLIDFGVEAVIGNHAHCMHEVEIYRGKPIAYGEGNFYMPGGYFFNGSLVYPEKSHTMYVVSLDNSPQFSQIGGVQVNIFSTDLSNGEAIALRKVETVETAADNSVLHIAGEYEEKEYIRFFRKNRIKRKMVPVFDSYGNGVKTRLRTEYSIARIKAIRAIKMFSDRRKD